MAILKNSDLGGIAAWPAGAGIIAVGGTVMCGCVLVPSCAAGRIACHLLKLSAFAAMPVVFVFAMTLCYGLYWLYIEAITTSAMPPFQTFLVSFLKWAAIPIGGYWVVTEATQAALERMISKSRFWYQNNASR